MFISRKMHEKIISAKEQEIKELNRRINKQEESLKDLRDEINCEHLENHKNHRKLLEIKILLQEQDYNNAENLKNKIRTILNKSYQELTHNQLR